MPIYPRYGPLLLFFRMIHVGRTIYWSPFHVYCLLRVSCFRAIHGNWPSLFRMHFQYLRLITKGPQYITLILTNTMPGLAGLNNDTWFLFLYPIDLFAQWPGLRELPNRVQDDSGSMAAEIWFQNILPSPEETNSCWRYRHWYRRRQYSPLRAPYIPCTSQSSQRFFRGQNIIGSFNQDNQNSQKASY